MEDLEENLIIEYKQAKTAYYTICKKLENFYKEKVKECIENNNERGLRSLINRCPDSVICAFILDAIKYRLKEK
jgi:hypothetical protein